MHWLSSVPMPTLPLMISLPEWTDSMPLSSPRLLLEPLRVEHAEEMAPLLDDPDLHIFIGGEPVTREELQERYLRQVVGRSADGSQRWLNWILRRRDNGRVVGTVQATVVEDAGRLSAEVAWVIGSRHQNQGYAREAAEAMVRWLRQEGAAIVVAHVDPQHLASVAVARAVGLAPTDTVVEGEVRFEA